MKTFRILLAFLLLVGLVLIVTKQYWLPVLVETILMSETSPPVMVPEGQNISPNDFVSTTSTQTGMDAWNWVYATTSSAGTQFMYPNPIPTTYVSPVEWPPQVIVTTGRLSCTEGDMASHGGEVTTATVKTINTHVYCVAEAKQGAAGTTYTQYQYATEVGDFVASVSFTLKTPQCMNYDEPKQSECLTEQAALSVDLLADRIIQSITMR